MRKITSAIAASSGSASAPASVAKTSTLAGRALARLEAAAAEVHRASLRERELQLVSTQAGGFSALIKHGKTVVEIQGDSFAVRQMD
jgi:hypothetical protein